jgi:hypothetical protein
MITKNFQKLGALVASLVGILTLSSAAEAITFTAVGGAIGRTTGTLAQRGNAATKTYTLTPTDTREVIDVTSFTINGLTYANKSKLKATITYAAGTDDQLSAVLFNTGDLAGALNGNYTFLSSDAPSGLDWRTSTGASGTYKSADSFSIFGGGATFLNGGWSLELQNNANVGLGSFSSFSIDASPVPFDSNAAPAGVVIVFGALMLRRKLQQRSAQKMSLELVNS